MKLYISTFAPNPRRVTMFIAEKGITGIENVMIDLAAGEHRSASFIAKNPLARVPALEFDDGRVLCETRAICTYLEGMYPETNLMGEGFEERAFIEMADRRAELHLFAGIANCVRHTHPGLAMLEQPQFPEFGASQGEKMREAARWLDGELANQPIRGGTPFYRGRYHGVLRARIRARADEVPPGGGRDEQSAGVARPDRRAADRRPAVKRQAMRLYQGWCGNTGW
jgi:glutathione S-transferase